MNVWYEFLDMVHGGVYDFSPRHMIRFFNDMDRIRNDPRHCFCQDFHYNWRIEATAEHELFMLELLFNQKEYTYFIFKDFNDNSVEVFDNVYRYL